MSSTLTFIKNMELPIYFFNNRFKTKTFSKFPFFTFNNGVPCLALNSYIQSEEIIKLSDETIFKTAYSLTHIIRFCENNKIKFSHFSENDFVAFSHSLQEEDRENRTLKRRGGLIDYRYVPVNKADFNEVLTYIKIYRSKIIKNTISKANDEGFLLVNENAGKFNSFDLSI